MFKSFPDFKITFISYDAWKCPCTYIKCHVIFCSVIALLIWFAGIGIYYKLISCFTSWIRSTHLILVEIRPLYTSIDASLEGSIFHSASNDYETMDSVSGQLSRLILKSGSSKHGWKKLWFTVHTCSVDCHNFTKWARAQFVLCQHTELVLCPRLQPWHHQPRLSTRNWHWMPVVRTEVYSLWPKNRKRGEKTEYYIQ